MVCMLFTQMGETCRRTACDKLLGQRADKVLSGQVTVVEHSCFDVLDGPLRGREQWMFVWFPGS